MALTSRARRAILAAALALMASSAAAQEISDSHLKAARAAVSSIRATDQFDLVLPQAAAALKGELIQKDPNLQDLISRTVDEKALALAARRADLEKEAATVYARIFSEEELNTIASFYSSPAGQKLISDGPIATRQLLEAADIWQRGIARDLAQSVAEVLSAQAPQNQAGEPPAPQPAQ